MWYFGCSTAKIYFLPKMDETNLISNHSFLLICQIKILQVFLFSSIYFIVTLITLEKHTKEKSQPSASHPFPSFLYTLLNEMWMVKCNVCGYLWKLHVLSFFPQKQATFSAALTWLSSAAKGVLQICPSGGFRPVFSFLLRFLVLFFVVAFIFYTKQTFFLIIISLWVSC